MTKKACFIFGFPIRIKPALITMPFGLNVVKLIKKEGIKLDVFLSEYTNESYLELEDSRCSINFIDSNKLWRNQ